MTTSINRFDIQTNFPVCFLGVVLSFRVSMHSFLFVEDLSIKIFLILFLAFESRSAKYA